MLDKLVRAPKDAFDAHVGHERKSAHKRLKDDDMMLIATLALVSVALSAVARIMQVSKFASMPIEEIRTYHWVTPWLTVVATLLFMYVVWAKGIKYWLVYATSVLTMLPNMVHIMLLIGAIQPSDLSLFDFGPSWWRGT